MKFAKVQLAVASMCVLLDVIYGLVTKNCGVCDRTKCPSTVGCQRAEHVIMDMCSCCLVCVTVEELGKVKLKPAPADVCKSISCPRFEKCILNIQDIPVCRCPSLITCPQGKGKEVCGQDRVTYKSRCHKSVAECQQKRKIRVAYKGKCIENINQVSEKKLGKISRQEFRRMKRRRMCNKLMKNMVGKGRREVINKKFKCWKYRAARF